MVASKQTMFSLSTSSNQEALNFTTLTKGMWHIGIYLPPGPTILTQVNTKITLRVNTTLPLSIEANSTPSTSIPILRPCEGLEKGALEASDSSTHGDLGVCRHARLYVRSPCHGLALRLEQIGSDAGVLPHVFVSEVGNDVVMSKSEESRVEWGTDSPTLQGWPTAGEGYSTCLKPASEIVALKRDLWLDFETDGYLTEASWVHIRVCCPEGASCVQDYKLEGDTPSLPVQYQVARGKILTANVNGGEINWHKVCLSDLKEGLEISTASVKVGEPESFFVVTQSPPEGLGLTKTKNLPALPMPSLKAYGLFQDDVPGSAGSKTIGICTQRGLRGGRIYIGVFTYCVAYAPHFEPNRIADVNKKVNCQPGVSYFFEVSRPIPKCSLDCASNVVFPSDSTKVMGSSEVHGTCTGCRAFCVCNEDWHGAACQVSECPADNCYGQGTCEDGSCVCKDNSTVAKGFYCERRQSKMCPKRCYGNGNCDTRLESYSSNITVGSCECVSPFFGHLCTSVPNVDLPTVTPAIMQLISIGMVVFSAFMWGVYSLYNQMLNANFEYAQVRRVTSSFEDEKVYDDVLYDFDDDDEGGDQDGIGMKDLVRNPLAAKGEF